MVQRTKGQTLLTESERIIDKYITDRDFIKKLFSEKEPRNQLEHMLDYLNSKGYQGLVKLFEAYPDDFDAFMEVLKERHGTVYDEVAGDKIGIVGGEVKEQKPAEPPKKISDVTGLKHNYWKESEEIFIKSRANEKSNAKLQKDFSQYFGYERSLESIKSKKYRLRTKNDSMSLSSDVGRSKNLKS